MTHFINGGKNPRLKILYAIQGTGNGHLSRAREIVPVLQKKGEVDLLVSGIQADVSLPFPIKYTFRGLSFIFGKKGGVDIWETYVKANLKNLLTEIKQLPVEKYDLIINDFEPVSAWACYRKKIPCVALSHQAAVLTPEAPQPKKPDWFGKFILRNYAPTSYQFGFHFQAYNANTSTPVIRSEIRNLTPEKKDHYTVYLPAYNDNKLLKFFEQLPGVRWEIFSKHNLEEIWYKNIHIQPINNEKFIYSLATSEGVICGAGFETPAEALYLKKKLLVIPMKGQYEQQCNAAALKALGVPVIKKLKEKHLPKISDWIGSGITLDLDFPDHTEQVIDKLIYKHYAGLIAKESWKEKFDLLPAENILNENASS